MFIASLSNVSSWILVARSKQERERERVIDALRSRFNKSKMSYIIGFLVLFVDLASISCFVVEMSSIVGLLACAISYLAFFPFC